MKKKLVSFVCAVIAALCLAVSVPVQAYAAPEDEIALQYTGISEISANLYFENGVAYCRGTTHAHRNYTVNLVMVLKRSNVEYARWEDTVTFGGILLEKSCNITHGHVYQVVVTAYVYNSAGKLVETQTAETSIKAY